jgi:hypothetical protein
VSTMIFSPSPEYDDFLSHLLNHGLKNKKYKVLEKNWFFFEKLKVRVT